MDSFWCGWSCYPCSFTSCQRSNTDSVPRWCRKSYKSLWGHLNTRNTSGGWGWRRIRHCWNGSFFHPGKYTYKVCGMWSPSLRLVLRNSFRKHESDPYADACTDSYILVRDNWTLLTHIPLFLIADGNNIMNLMTSALYQRYVWSINEPLIGIELMGRYARVYLGWLDYDSGYEQSVSMKYWFYFI